jgi:RES domain-containing protein
VKAKYAATAFDGEGAGSNGGRWNSPGVPMVYTADSPALAALETLVGLNDYGFLSAFVLFSVDFPEAAAEAIDIANLPANWRSFPAPPELPLIGDTWLKASSSAVLRVPSALIEQQSNYLLNPQHADFSSITIGLPQPFTFDDRLLRRS